MGKHKKVKKFGTKFFNRGNSQKYLKYYQATSYQQETSYHHIHIPSNFIFILFSIVVAYLLFTSMRNIHIENYVDDINLEFQLPSISISPFVDSFGKASQQVVKNVPKVNVPEFTIPTFKVPKAPKISVTLPRFRLPTPQISLPTVSFSPILKSIRHWIASLLAAIRSMFIGFLQFFVDLAIKIETIWKTTLNTLTRVFATIFQTIMIIWKALNPLPLIQKVMQAIASFFQSITSFIGKILRLLDPRPTFLSFRQYIGQQILIIQTYFEIVKPYIEFAYKVIKEESIRLLITQKEIFSFLIKVITSSGT